MISGVYGVLRCEFGDIRTPNLEDSDWFRTSRFGLERFSTVSPIASVIVFHDKMNGVKIISMLLAILG